MKHLILSLSLLTGCMYPPGIEVWEDTPVELWSGGSGMKILEHCASEDCDTLYYQLILPASDPVLFESCRRLRPSEPERCDMASRVEHLWAAETYKCLSDLKVEGPDPLREETCRPQSTPETRVLAHWLSRRGEQCRAQPMNPDRLSDSLAWFTPDFLEAGRVCAGIESCKDFAACLQPWSAIAQRDSDHSSWCEHTSG